MYLAERIFAEKSSMTTASTPLLNVVRQFIPLSADEERIVEQRFEPHQIKPNDYFLQAGEVCRYVGFVTEGQLGFLPVF